MNYKASFYARIISCRGKAYRADDNDASTSTATSIYRDSALKVRGGMARSKTRE